MNSNIIITVWIIQIIRGEKHVMAVLFQFYIFSVLAAFRLSFMFDLKEECGFGGAMNSAKQIKLKLISRKPR